MTLQNTQAVSYPSLPDMQSVSEPVVENSQSSVRSPRDMILQTNAGGQTDQMKFYMVFNGIELTRLLDAGSPDPRRSNRLEHARFIRG